MKPLPCYDLQQSYQWNYDHAPEPVDFEIPPVTGTWTYCGLPVDSPLSIAAGPLLNGRWCLYYASLGFDTVTYKTVRSGARSCYSLPNLQPVACGSLDGSESSVPAQQGFDGSWAVSFGMPSQAPEVWRANLAETRMRLPRKKLLSVSVVGTTQPGWSIERLAEDYAMCANLAVDGGADTIEFNLSCPNVTSCDGQLYQLPDQAAIVAKAVRDAVRGKPTIAKIGYFRVPREISPLVDSLAEHVTAIATTNCIALKIEDIRHNALFDGHPRGIAGRAILDASVRQTERIADYIARHSLPIRLIGVGGICSAVDAKRYLSVGAEAVQLATAAMTNPSIGIEIRDSWMEINL